MVHPFGLGSGAFYTSHKRLTAPKLHYPLFQTINDESFYFTIYWDDANNRFVFLTRIISSQICHIFGLKIINYGNYEWNGRIDYSQANSDCFMSFEEPGFTGGIGIWDDSTTEKFNTSTGGAATSTNLAGVDFTSEDSLRLEWSVGLAVLDVNGVQKASHNTDVPTGPLQPTLKSYTFVAPPANTPIIRVDREFFEGVAVA